MPSVDRKAVCFSFTLCLLGLARWVDFGAASVLTKPITGGSGFIGSNLVRFLIAQGYQVCDIDALAYAGNRSSLTDLEANPAYAFHKLDIAKGDFLHELVAESKPDAVLHLAAESHVDRSIDGITYVTDRPGHGMRYAIDASKLKREL